MKVFRLTFPPDLKESAINAALGGLAHDLYRNRQPRPVISLRLIATQNRIEHHLEVPELMSGTVLGRLRSVLPSVRIEPIENRMGAQPRLVVELRITARQRPLRIDRSASTSSGILSAASSLRKNERLEMCWTLAGAPPARPPRQQSGLSQGALMSSLSFLIPNEAGVFEMDALRQHRAKQAEPLLFGVVRIAAWAPNIGRARGVATPLVSALRTTSAPGVALIPRRLPQVWLRRQYSVNGLPLALWPIVLNSAEATPLVAWPIDGPQVPGLSLNGSRQLAPTRNLSQRPCDGVVIADSTFPGVNRPLVLKDQDRLLHTHVIGPTGVGKSTLLGNMIVSDAEHGHGVIVLDPGRDLVNDVLDRLPSHRHGDVILLDPNDTQFPVGLNPLQGAGRSPDLVAEQLVGVIRSIFSNYWGPRSDDILRTAVLTLCYARADASFTMLDIPKILTNPTFRRQVVGKVKDPTLLSSWSSFETLSDAARAQAIGPVLNKLRAFLLRPGLRNILGQAEPGWSIDSVLSDRKILLVPLSGGEIGEDAASLLGALLFARVWQAAQRRSSLAASDRTSVMVYLDEFQTLLKLPAKTGDVLARARKLGLGLTLAHQHFGQLTPEVRTDVLANARSRIVFQLGLDDSRLVAKQMPEMSQTDLLNLPRYEVVARLAVDGGTAPAVTGTTRPLGRPHGRRAALVKQSRGRFGRPISEVEEELHRGSESLKHGWDVADVIVGSKPVRDDDEPEVQL